MFVVADVVVGRCELERLLDMRVVVMAMVMCRKSVMLQTSVGRTDWSYWRHRGVYR